MPLNKKNPEIKAYSPGYGLNSITAVQEATAPS